MKKMILIAGVFFILTSLAFTQEIKKISVVQDSVDPKTQTFKNDLFFMTGFVPSEKNGQAFIFADDENKANAIYMKNIFEGGRIGEGVEPEDDKDFEDIKTTGKPELSEEEAEYAWLKELLD